MVAISTSRSRRATARVNCAIFLFSLVVTACDGDHEDPVTTHCRRACSALASCGNGSLDIEACVLYCENAVVAAGDIGPLGASLCADCLESSTCTEIAVGTCDTVCGDGDLLPDPDFPPITCEESWQEDGITWEVRCEGEFGDQEIDCDCYENGVRTEGFSSINFCDVDTTARLDQANRGCYWDVGVRDDCSQEFVYQESYRQIACEGSITGWDCTCSPYDGAGDGTFVSQDFCDLGLEERYQVGIETCGFTMDGKAPCLTGWAYDVWYKVDCDAGVCDCIADEVTESSFTSDIFCALTHADQTTVAEQECGWAIP